MKVSVNEDNNRTIGRRDHNKYVAEGINCHKATQVAPPSLLQQFDVTLQDRIQGRYRGRGGQVFYLDIFTKLGLITALGSDLNIDIQRQKERTSWL